MAALGRSISSPQLNLPPNLRACSRSRCAPRATPFAVRLHCHGDGTATGRRARVMTISSLLDLVQQGRELVLGIERRFIHGRLFR
jgi:hypothetical protein